MASPKRQTPLRHDDRRSDRRRPTKADFTVGPSGRVAPASQERGGGADPIRTGPSARPGRTDRPVSAQDDPVRQSIAEQNADRPVAMTPAIRLALGAAAVAAVVVLILLI
ncbi:hypothetical protein [Histidinibacterium lentulum]|uniref:Uncharacterized protein n=1 Tax=Histidinibacterium lentulum TaxID=2480588 RepID=A0A3N2R8T6_9RHOB|nr:hypothetical protein [Histidinibacterium lentulum]ROU03746.1 hypothetical protein EAT49_05485 [Histidinibacterium lentulum]